MFLLIMAITMFVSTVVVSYFAFKKRTPNKFIWPLIPFFRGLEWLAEYIADFIENELDLEPPFFLDRFELTFGFIASMAILAACLEFNGAIQKPLGKIGALLVGLVPIFFLLILNEEVLVSIEENYLFEDLILISDPFRFLYGFLILILATIGLLLTHIIYLRQTRKGKFPKDEKMHIKIAFMTVIIVITSIFNGFDYEESITEEVTFIIMRGVTTIPFMLLPIFVILTNKSELNIFIIIKSNGIPMYAFNIRENIELSGDNFIIITAGFLTALTNISKELSSKTRPTLTISSGNFYYLIFQTGNHIYSLQAGYYNKHLEAKFNQLSKDFEKKIASKEEISAYEEVEIKNLLLAELSDFI
ncbi:MAG: hypothetical protein ACW99E_22290 [Promethearchaeota archaeon]